VSLAIPRVDADDFFFEGVPIVTEMMEIEVFAKGYYLIEGVPQYYPIFWGLITEVSDSYSSGEHTVTLQCSDILKWWELCQMNINPAFTAASGQAGRSLFGNVFFGMNPYDVVWTLAQSAFGDVVVGTGSLISMYKESGPQKRVFDSALSDIMLYWEERFSRIRSNILLYGVNGVAVRGDSLYEAYRHGRGGTLGKPFASAAVRTANGGKENSQTVFDPTDPSVVAYRTQFSNAGQVNFWQSEYQTKLEIANAAKEAIGFELYMDVDGTIVFKPPFYNVDVLPNKPVSWIQDIDIIDWNFSQSEAEVVTQVQLQGAFGGNIDYGMPQEVTPFTSVTDYHLLRKYGWRTHTYNSEFMADPMLMFYHGMDILDRLNSRRHRGSVTIPMRPELRLGFPIYIAPKDQIWYITGISHAYSAGGRSQTTLTLTARRCKFFAPRGIGDMELTGWKGSGKPPVGKTAFPYSSKQLARGGTFRLRIGEAAQVPPQVGADQGPNSPYAPLLLRHPKTGRFVGYPNVVMAYTRPFTPSPDELKRSKGQKTGDNPYTSKETKEKLERSAQALSDYLDKALVAGDNDRLREKHLTNRYQYGLNSAGVYAYARDKSAVIGEILLFPTGNLTLDPKPATPVFQGSTAMIRPVSDERGFEVIGHFRYGRGVSLQDGRLIAGNPQDKVSVGVQAALSGDLFATLSSQSQGLTSVTTVYPSPAEAITRLQMEDLQTAGILNPETKKAEFVGDTFIDSAVIGSPEQAGVPTTAEASQLSKALTITELTVARSSGVVDPNCACTLGRSDLTFLRTGFQVKFMDGTVPDEGLGLTPGTDGTFLYGDQGLSSLGDPIEQPVAIANPLETASQVDRFLYTLYEVLDEGHQAHEQVLRGEALVQEEAGAGTGSVPGETPFDPPFSASNRALLGDQEAIALQGSSATTGLADAWSRFGNSLKTNTKRAEYQALIDQAQTEIASLTKERQEILQRIQFGSSFPTDPSERLRQIDARIALLQRQVADNRLRLQELAGP
jgi:hypothetical protein